MTTPLQQAAQAMIDRWESPDWKDTPHTAHYVAELRKALDAELAQCKQIHVTEAMHRAAVKVLHRAPGVAGLPQRMMDAMLAAQGEKP